MSRHTAGPWRYGAHLSPSENHRGYYIVADGSDGWAHATVQPGDEDGVLGEANARLIAAAPTMHALLTEIVDACDADDQPAFVAAVARAAQLLGELE